MSADAVMEPSQDLKLINFFFPPSLGLKHKTDSQFLAADVIDKASVTDWSRSGLFALIHINRKLSSNIVRAN